MYDAIVVGGGPVGSQAAFRLSTAGYHVLVIEKKVDYQAPVCCTGIISEECFHRYKIDPAVVYRHVNCASVFSPSGTRIYLKRPAPQAVILNRPAFNQFMAKRAQNQGAEYLQGTTAIRLQVNPEEVTLLTDNPENRTITAKTVIIASGANVSLLKSINIHQPAVFAAGAQAEVFTHDVTEVEVYTGHDIAAGYFAWLVPTSEGKALAGLLTYRQPGEHLKKFLTNLKYLGKILSSDVPVITGTVPVRAVPQTVTDLILVTGTTAGLVKPTTGGGIYYGLLSADIAVDTIQEAFASGNFRKSSYTRYRQECQKILGKELRLGTRARLLFEHLSDANIDHIFDIINKNNLMDRLLSCDDVSFDWHSTAISHLLQETTLAKLLRGLKLFFPGKRPGKDSNSVEES
jgi:digeranylgeranylglycerophospholipid reductase